MYHSLKYSFRGKRYRFCSVFGLLLSKKISKNEPNLERVCPALPCKVSAALAVVDDPYTVSLDGTAAKTVAVSKAVRCYGLLLIWLHRHFYPGLWLLSHLRLNVYDNAEEAIDVFCRIHPADQKLLCLPRSVFGATLSRRFKREGALFISVFLPSHHMHAFVIENGRNAYRSDYGWINYTPISIMS